MDNREFAWEMVKQAKDEELVDLLVANYKMITKLKKENKEMKEILKDNFGYTYNN